MKVVVGVAGCATSPDTSSRRWSAHYACGSGALRGGMLTCLAAATTPCWGQELQWSARAQRGWREPPPAAARARLVRVADWGACLVEGSHLKACSGARA